MTHVPEGPLVAPILHNNPDTDPARQPHVVLFHPDTVPTFGVEFGPEQPADSFQAFARDAVRIPHRGNDPGKALADNLVAIHNLGDPLVKIEGHLMMAAVRFWERSGIEASFYGSQEAHNIFGFRVDEGLLSVIGISEAQRVQRMQTVGASFEVTNHQFVLATARNVIQHAKQLADLTRKMRKDRPKP